MSVELKVPEVGESITDVVIGQWSIEEGKSVDKESPVVEIETDKITLELPAPVAGKVTKIVKKQGDEAKVGDVIGYMEEGEISTSETSKSTTSQTESAEASKRSEDTSGGTSGGGGTRVMPAAQRLLEEHDLDASQVSASGPGGRLLKEDVERYVESTSKQRQQEGPRTGFTPEPAAAPRQEEVVAMTPLRKRIAERLVDAQHNAALLTTFNEVDMSHVMAMRNQYKQAFIDRYETKLGFMSFFVKATIDALKAYPSVNAEIRGTDIVYKNYFDIGIAVGSGKGLVVPVLRDAERMSFAEIELAIADFAKRIRDNKIKLEELTGGTFTITNGGVYGSMLSTPIINPPQSGVLGMHGIIERPIAVDGEAVVRPMMYVALTYDHRLVDGREAVGFLVRIKQAIEDPSRMLMEI